MVYLDANVFVFAALATDKLGEAARHILANLSKVRAKTSCLTMDELAWAVLRRSDVKTAVENCRAAMGLRGLDISPVEYDDVWGMTREMAALELKPRDALHLATMRRLGEKTIVSEDPHFDKADVKRVSIKIFAKSI